MIITIHYIKLGKTLKHNNKNKEVGGGEGIRG